MMKLLLKGSLSFILIMGCGLLTLHCDEQAVTNENQTVHLIPMASGNQWHYEVNLVDSLGTVLATSNESVRIYGDTLVGGSIWFGFSAQGYRINKADGVWQLLPTPYLEFPLDIGDSVLQGNGATYIRLTSKGTRVSIPAGTYVCFEYSETNPLFSLPVNKYYIAPSLGLVKKEVYGGLSPYPTTVSQLVVAELK